MWGKIPAVALILHRCAAQFSLRNIRSKTASVRGVQAASATPPGRGCPPAGTFRVPKRSRQGSGALRNAPAGFGYFRPVESTICPGLLPRPPFSLVPSTARSLFGGSKRECGVDTVGSYGHAALTGWQYDAVGRRCAPGKTASDGLAKPACTLPTDAVLLRIFLKKSRRVHTNTAGCCF